MLLNKSEAHIEEKLRRELSESAVAQALSAALDAAAEPFEIEPEGAGLEVRACAILPSGVPNRARLKIFSPRRGGIDLRSDAMAPEDVAQWLTFLSSGFHPDRRPSHLRRAFPYEIPE